MQTRATDEQKALTQILRYRIWGALALLVCGLGIYVFFRHDIIFVQWFTPRHIGLFHEQALAHASNPVCSFFLYNLPDALWYAALLVVQRPLRTLGVANAVLYWACVALPFALEILQSQHVIAGTFDVIDLTTYLFTFFIVQLW